MNLNFAASEAAVSGPCLISHSELKAVFVPGGKLREVHVPGHADNLQEAFVPGSQKEFKP